MEYRDNLINKVVSFTEEVNLKKSIHVTLITSSRYKRNEYSDVHLKGWMFEEADRLMAEHGITQAVCLGDLVDDWSQQLNRAAYEAVYEKVFWFDARHPNTLWCYGNHDLSYVWHRLESGYSPYQELVGRKILEMRRTMNERLAYAHFVGKCLFTHATSG